MTETFTIRVDRATRDRLAALAKRMDRSTADVVRTLSYASLSEVLKCTAARAVAERGKGAAD